MVFVHRSLIVAALALGVMLLASAASAGEHVFVGASKCGLCHKKKLIGKQYAVWKKSAHAQAYKTLAGDKAGEYAKAAGLEGNPQELEECLRCHVTGAGLPPERFEGGRPKLSQGVGCESCHGAGKDYRKKKLMSDLEKAKAKGLKIPEEADCLECHNDDSPAWDPERYTLADGSHVGFDFEQAAAKIEHPIPPDVKGRYVELSRKK